jgi:hypothetical protein
VCGLLSASGCSIKFVGATDAVWGDVPATTSRSPITEPSTTASPPETTPTTETPTTAAGTHVCSGSDLVAIENSMDGAMGSVRVIVQITNVSASRCTLPLTAPTLAGVRADGTVVPLVPATSQTTAEQPAPLTAPLAVGGTAVVWITGGEPSFCDPIDQTQTWPTMVLGLPDGTTIPFTTNFDTKCELYSISSFGTA